jgi:hypothetical protein
MERVIRLKREVRFYYDACRYVKAGRGTRFTIDPATNQPGYEGPPAKFWGTPVSPRHPVNAVAGNVGCMLYEGEDF